MAACLAVTPPVCAAEDRVSQQKLNDERAGIRTAIVESARTPPP